MYQLYPDPVLPGFCYNSLIYSDRGGQQPAVPDICFRPKADVIVA